MSIINSDTFLGMFLNSNNEIIDTCVFAIDATEDHINDVIELKKQLNNNIISFINSKEYGVGAIGWELYNNILRNKQPFLSYTWNELLKKWEPPTPYPNDGKDYIWNENILNWEEIQVSE